MNTDMNTFKKIEKITITENIIEQIKQMIINGQIVPGQKLPSERDLAEMLLVSRPTVREAMKSLQSMGIVEIRTGNGTYLNNDTDVVLDHFQKKQLLKKFSVMELIETRRIIEVDMAGLASERRDKKDIVKLKKYFSETIMPDISDEARVHADFSLHMTIAEASKNRFLYEMLYTVRDLLIDVNTDLFKISEQVSLAQHSHESLINAIINKNKELAENEMWYHLQTIENSVRKIYNL